jgi:integrase
MAGNVTKRKPGHYRLRYKDYTRNIQAKTDSEAEKLLAKFITEIENGDFSQPSKITFREFVKKWLENYAETELAPKTLFRYKQMLESRILPTFGNRRLEKIKSLDLLNFYKSIKGKHKYIKIKIDGTRKEAISKGLADKTIRHHHGIISAIFEKAIKWDVYKGDNPARHVDAPKIERKKAACYDIDQIEAMLNVLQGEELRHQAAVMIALTCGMRLGEICGLEWQDIDFDKNTIEIRQSSQYLPGQGVFTKDPKTESSKRKISVNDALLKLLRVYQEDQKDKGFLSAGNNRLFVMFDGNPMFPNAMSKWFSNFIKRHKLPKLSFHGLRHTSATFLISQGMDVQTVAGRLGHTTSATTQNIYSHFLKSKDQQAAELMEKAFSKNDKGPKIKKRGAK